MISNRIQTGRLSNSNSNKSIKYSDTYEYFMKEKVRMKRGEEISEEEEEEIERRAESLDDVLSHEDWD